MTTIEVFDTASGTWEPIRFQSDWKIELGTSDTDAPAPMATVPADKGTVVTAGQGLRILDDGLTLFEGEITDAPINADGTRDIEAEDPAFALYDEEVSIDVTGPPTTQEVVSAALSASDRGADFTLSYPGAAPTLGEAYEVEGRTVRRVLRDMADRNGKIFYATPDRTIHVEDYGAAGTVGTIDTSATGYAAAVEEFDDTDLATVQNDITVIGTGGESVEGTAQSSGSISDYGKRSKRVNVSYITTESEATGYAGELLVPDPLPSLTAAVSANYPDADVRTPLVNQSVTVVDPSKGVDETVPVEKQVIEQGQVSIVAGAGVAAGVGSYNQDRKSDGDVTEPGSVYGNDRIGNDAVDTDQLVDTAVIEQKLADLSVSETKVQDDSIATPKLQAEAVTANEILAGTITALEIATGTLTANEIDTLDLTTQEISIGAGLDGIIEFDDLTISGTNESVAVMLPSTDNNCLIGLPSTRFAEVHAREMFANAFNTQSPEPLSADQIDLSHATEYGWYNPPEAVAQRHTGDRYKRQNPNNGVEIGHATNYVWELAKEIERERQALDDRVTALEERVAALEGGPNA